MQRRFHLARLPSGVSFFHAQTPGSLNFSFFSEYLSAALQCFDLEVLLIHDVGALDELPRACFDFGRGRTCEGKFRVPRSPLNQGAVVGCTPGGGAV